jgi:prolyl-tRNA editing enzyme YbaK/EbsC (Cys-tRNA(Pro) deacylase)
VVVLARGSKRVGEFLTEAGLEAQVVTLDDSTRTSQMAADALGCGVAQIAKSIVFIDAGAVVVVISGDKRVDPKKLSALLGEKVRIADADAVRKETGYVIGGVPPFPHDEGVKVFLDSSLGRFDEVWTAAGTPNSVMKILVSALRDIIGSGFVEIAK